jgi:hypothetical protein
MFAVSAKARTGSLRIIQRARCRTHPLRSDREKCLLLTSPFIEPAQNHFAGSQPSGSISNASVSR